VIEIEHNASFLQLHKDKIPQPDITYPRVVESKGKNPEQYPDWEYEEE